MKEKKEKVERLLRIGLYIAAFAIFIVTGIYLYNDKYTFYLESEEITLSNDEEYKVGIIAKDYEYTDSKNYTFKSSNEKVIKVSPEGLITTISPGTANLIVKSKKGSSKQQMKIDVMEMSTQNNNSNSTPVEINSISLSNKELSIIVGEEKYLYVKNGEEYIDSESLIWSSDNDYVIVERGKIIAVKEGSSIVTVETDTGIKDTCRITISKQTTSTPSTPSTPSNPSTPTTVEAKEIYISKKTLTLKETNTYTLTASISPSNASNKVTWVSGDESIATVSKGVITAKKEGQTYIIAKTDNGLSATCVVNVEKKVVVSNEVAVSKITLNKTSATIQIGETIALKQTISPSNATDKSVSWSSSDPSIVEVSYGTITGIKEGTATITVTSSNGKKATSKITVKKSTSTNVEVTEVKLNKSNSSISIGTDTILEATIIPSNASNKSLTWTSSNTKVATVTNGVVKALSTGTTTVTVRSSNGKTASCTVTVENKVTSIALNKTSVDINIAGSNKTEQLSVTITPSNATNKTIKWSSNNTKVAKVSNNGLVTALAKGKASITATSSNGKTATATINVIELVNETGVSVNPSSIEIFVGETKNITATVAPSNATYKTVKWDSANTSIATVTNGAVKGVKAGNTIIKVSTKNGKTATVSVKVKSAIASIKTASSTKFIQEKLGTEIINVKDEAATVTLFANITENLSIAANQNITINGEGHTISSDSSSDATIYIANSGKLTLNNATVSASKYNAVINSGTFIFNATLKSSNTEDRATLVGNDGSTTTMKGGSVSSDKANTVIIYGGTFTMDDGTISSKSRVAIGTYGTTTIRGGTITSNDSYAIYSTGTTNISGGTITSDASSAVTIYSIGTTNISGGTISSTNGYALYVSEGTTTVSGGKINSSENEAIHIGEKGTLNVSSGEISSKSRVAIGTYGTTTIRGGTITSNNSLAIYSEGTTNISGGTISSTNCRALYVGEGTTTVSGGKINSSEDEAIRIREKGTLNVSSGEISSKSGIAIDTFGTTTIRGGTITSTSNHALRVYEGTTTVSGGKINSSENEAIRIEKKGTLNVSSGEISSKSDHAIVTFGTTTIRGGTISSTNSWALYVNDGTTTVSGGKINSSEDDAIHIGEKGTLNVSSGEISSKSRAAIGTFGTTTISGGTIKNDSSSFSTIYSNGTTNISGGTITSNNSSTIYSNGTTNISGGTITSNNYTAIFVSEGTTKISGTTVKIKTMGNSSSYALKVDTKGTAIVTGGELYSKNGITVINYGKLTLGDKNTSLSTSTPSVISDAAQNYIVVQCNKKENCFIYDGIYKKKHDDSNIVDSSKVTLLSGYKMALKDRTTDYYEWILKKE